MEDKMGIGRPPGKMNPASYVLRPFTKQEREELDFTFQHGTDAVRILLLEGFNKAATFVNTAKPLEQCVPTLLQLERIIGIDKTHSASVLFYFNYNSFGSPMPSSLDLIAVWFWCGDGWRARSHIRWMIGNAVPATERASLLSFALALSSPTFLKWTSDDCCRWQGINCDEAGWVTHLSLPSKGLTFKQGTSFPSSKLAFGNLTHLTHLNLSHNSLNQTVASFLSLSHLEALDLSSNLLSGELPLSLPSSIQVLDLSNNQFSGSIPSTFFRQAKNLTSFRECSKLKAFRAGHNNLSGVLLEDIYNATKLEELAMPFNSLDGVIGDRIVNLTNLAILDLQVNQLRDEESPADFGIADFDGFQSLRFLNLGGCTLAGEIPTWLTKLKNLEVLTLLSNKLTGPIPSQLGNLSRLFYLNFGSNRIVGEIPKQLLRLPTLVSKSNRSADQDVAYDLELPVTRFSTSNEYSDTQIVTKRGAGRIGGIGQQFNSLSFFPRAIFLGHNSFNGTIPIEIGHLVRLQTLELNHNNFSGNIPAEISNLKDLSVLLLNENHLSGQIPSSLNGLSFLSDLNVSYNNLERQIPKGTQIQGFDVYVFEGNPKLCGLPLPNECQAVKGIDDLDVDEEEEEEEHQTAWPYVHVGIGFIIGFWGVCGSLIFNKRWRYAYFRFIEKVQTMFYVMIAVRVNKMKRRINSS
ncbi:hypothetical protein ACLB2K_051974 [Fragaria x ananassa]